MNMNIRADGLSSLTSAIITICVGREQRLFAAHEDVLCQSPYLHEACRAQFLVDSTAKRIDLPADQPEVFSSVLEYLYKGDYTPRLAYDKKRGTYRLEEANVSGVDPRTMAEMAVNANGVEVSILKDTVIYVSISSSRMGDLCLNGLVQEDKKTRRQSVVITDTSSRSVVHSRQIRSR